MIGNRTVEQMMDCIILVGEREWSNCKASVIIRDILVYFSERIEQDVQLVSIWEDITFQYIHFEYWRVREALDMIAQHTGSAMLCHDAQVSFIKKEIAWIESFV